LGKRQNSIHGGSANAELTSNAYLSDKPQNMLASLGSDWFSTLVFAVRLCFGDAFPMLRRQKLVQTWSDRRILVGDDWAGDIDEHLNSIPPPF
jgi:hypothetical protein